MPEDTLRRKLPRAIFRVGMTTFLATLISFAISLCFSLITLLIVNLVRGGGVNMTSAYRHIAFPVAMGVLVITFITAVILEIRAARREQASHQVHRAA